MKKLIFVIVVLLSGYIAQSCSDGAESGAGSGGSIYPAVEAVQARDGTLPLIQRLSGVVRAENQIAIYPEISAIILDVHVKNGDFVKKGTPLITLRQNEFRERLKQAQAGYQIAVAQLRQAEAQLNEVQAELKRTKILADQGMSSPTELETVQTRAISAEATVELARARVEQAAATVEERNVNMSQTVIRAPVSGSVGNRSAEIGMLVTTGTRLFTLGQLDKVRIEVILTDRMITYIEKGMRSEISAPALSGLTISAPLSRISPFLNPVSHSTEAEIDLENPEGLLISGMFVTVDIYYGESEAATLVPLSALYESPETGETGVYVSQEKLNREPAVKMDNDQGVLLTEPVRFKFLPVDVLARGRMEAGVTDVNPDDWVITLGHNLLGGQTGEARVRPVQWDWVEKLQRLQREDLMEEVVNRQRFYRQDTASVAQPENLIN